jgi:NAD(P)-dependent dehydrogenase (short-subunit alcohol dehydrogenase family)
MHTALYIDSNCDAVVAYTILASLLMQACKSLANTLYVTCPSSRMPVFSQAVRAVAERAVTALTADPALELACGPTPAYSLSKALLNAATRCSSNSNGASSYGVSPRVFAVCPGDVATRMCSAAAGDAVLSAEAAAEHIVAMALQPGEFTSGSFYRFRESIPW